MNEHDQQPHERSAGGRPPRLRVLDGSGQPQPHSRAAEAHVLACCLLDNGVTFARCEREKITPDAFYLPQNAKVYVALGELSRAGKPLTLEVLAEELRARKQFDLVGGMPYLLEITSDIGTTAHAGYFIEKLREQWVLRRLLVCGLEMLQGIDEYSSDLEAFVSRHSLRLQRWADFVTRCNRPGAAEEAAAAKLALEEIIGGKIDKSRQLSLGTGYSDRVLLPWDVKNEDWYVVLCGPPSGGKSSHARQVVGANCRTEKRGAVFLLETGRRRWQWALAASLAGVSLRDVLEQPGRMLPEQLKHFQAWDSMVTGWIGERLWVFDDMFHIEDIERSVRELDRSLREQEISRGVDPKTARGLDFVVIDYLQLLATREKIHKREEYVAHLSRTCKRMFKSMNVTGLVLAQLNRKPRDEERRPRLSDLRESGAIEQDADCVLAVHTPAKDRSGAPQEGDRSVHEVELIQLKRRNGPANIAVDLLFFKSQTRFQDAVRKGEARPGAPKPLEGYKRPGGPS